MMKKACFFVTSVLLFFCTGMKERGKIDYRILEREVHLRNESPNFEVTVELENSTSRNLILYGFRRTYSPFLSDSLLCIDRPGAGNAIFVTDSLGNMMPDEITIEMHGGEYFQKPVTDDSLSSVLKKVRSDYMNGKEILKVGQKRQAKVKIDLKNNPALSQLKPGKYLMYLMYYAGDDLTRVVEGTPFGVSPIEEATMKSDEKKYNAIVFRGWIKTNKINLVVE